MFEFIANVKWLLVEEDACGDMYKLLLISLLTNVVVPLPFLKLLLFPTLFIVLPKFADSLTDLFLLSNYLNLSFITTPLMTFDGYLSNLYSAEFELS